MMPCHLVLRVDTHELHLRALQALYSNASDENKRTYTLLLGFQYRNYFQFQGLIVDLLEYQYLVCYMCNILIDTGGRKSGQTSP